MRVRALPRAESSRAGEGTRLGLATARETIEALEERIETQSAPGKENAPFASRSQRKVNPL